MKDKFRIRQSTIVKSDDLDKPILLIGLGGIGSWTALALAKMGCQDMILCDFDKVGQENIGSQFYIPSDVESAKSEVMWEYLWNIYGTNALAENKKWQDLESLSPITICALDSMEERIKLWERVKKDPDVEWYIDARMGGEFMRIYTIDMLKGDFEFYEKTLVPEGQVEHVPCTERAIVYNVLIISGIISNQIKRICLKQPIYPKIMFDIPTMDLVAT